MANEIFKELKTRIALKQQTYAEWTANTDTGANYIPLYGEVCFCEIPAAPTTGNTEATNAPTVLFKVGTAKRNEDGSYVAGTDKKFSELKWASALAADVYAWAKKANPDWADFPALPLEVVDSGTGKFVTAFDYADNKLTITHSDVALDDISDKEKIALAVNLGVVTNLTTTAKTAVGAINEHDAEIGVLETLNTQDKSNLVNAINEALQAVETGGTGSVVTVTKADTPTEGSQVTYVVNQGGNAVNEKIEIPKYATSADYGVLGITEGDDTITIGGTPQNPTIAVAANKFDAYGAAAGVQSNLTAYENAHTADYTNAKIDELV